MARFLLSAFADEYADDFTAQLSAMKRLGVEYIELRHADKINVSKLTKAQITEISKKLSDFGVKVASIGSPLGKIALDGDLNGHFESAKRVFESAAALGTGLVRIFSFYPPEGKRIGECKEEVLCNLAKLIELADGFGLTLCHENEGEIYGEDPKRCQELLTTFKGKLRAVFDMGNFAFLGYDSLAAYRLLKEHIAYFHIKDALKAGAIVPPGKGEGRIAEILTDFRRTMKEDVFVTLEPHLQTFSGLNEIAGRAFDNPYKYETQEYAFLDALEKFRGILREVENDGCSMR